MKEILSLLCVPLERSEKGMEFLMNKKWECYEIDKKKLKEFTQKYNLNELLARVLLNKGITTKENIELFMNPTRKDFHNPFLMPDM